MTSKRAKPFAANLASTKSLEADGWTVQTVEQHIPHTFIKRDCFGFGDLLAVSPSRKSILLVQATGGGNGGARLAKIKMEPKAALWLAAGGRIQVHDWVKVKGQTKRECRVFEVNEIKEAE